jgi:TetR/AcrR family transcriptional regulator, repressor for neighboring sulfatase
MVASSGIRERQRAASEVAILDAAWAEFARTGPDGASLRDVAAVADRSHVLVTRYHGSKEGLVAAVAARLSDRVACAVSHAQETADPAADLLAVARQQRACTQLLVRSALGDLGPGNIPRELGTAWVLDETRAHAGNRRRAAGRRTRLLAYGAASLLLGWMTFDDFLTAATKLGRVGRQRRDQEAAAAGHRLMALAAAPPPRLVARDLSHHDASVPPLPRPATAQDALLRSAVELFASRGPASVSVRDIARYAGVNQGLIYRHFGSKDVLLAEAIEAGSSGLFGAAQAPGGFDFDAMSHLLHHRSPAPRLIARTLVDGIDITLVRRQFPVLHQLVAEAERASPARASVDPTASRFAAANAAAMALGSVIWGRTLRRACDLSARDGIASAIADLARFLVIAPTPPPRRRSTDQ